ncbi:hypothetical protein [Leptospira idonii]|uniref:Uncharacterized protein n=1 Tax=Leptospira idonii TaxID=1193500 RepID=A0A4R9M2K9_9LEPT|nr:hypothetical protein [Leptospira idonii]TGN19967.1 hypothetical protein EHS15_06210 [Leptospira idonii]
MPFSLNKGTITGKDVKSELKKVDETLVPLSLVASLNILSTSGSSSSTQRGVAKTCIGSYSDDSSPDFILPSPKDYTNVNLQGSVSIGNSQTWKTSVSLTESISVYPTLTSSSVTCYATSDALLATAITISTTSPFTLSSSTKAVSILCSTTSASDTSYTLSLNPRPNTSSTASSTSFSSVLSLEALFPAAVFKMVSGLKDSEIYTRESFEECKKNYERLGLTYAFLAGMAYQNISQCGGYNPPPAQVYVQASFCPLKPAGVFEI